MRPSTDDRSAVAPRLPMALAALFVLTGGTGCPAGAPAATPTQTGQAAGKPILPLTGILDAPESRRQFKAFWAQLDRGTGPSLYFQQHALARCFGMEEVPFREAMRETSWQAVGIPADASGRAALSLEDYALASLAELRIHMATFEAMALPTRMVMPPPSIHVERQLQEMEAVAQRVDQLRELRRREAIETEAFLLALDGLRAEVYHHCVLRASALAHARAHVTKPNEVPLVGGSTPLSDFYWHLEKSVVGSAAWLQRYDAAMERVAKDIQDPQFRGFLEKRQRTLAASLKQLEDFRPRLEAWFKELEGPRNLP